MLTDRYERALVYATVVHSAQRRKGTNIPYISHLLSVSALALEHGADEDQAIAALLHDAVEDQGGPPRLADIEARFGPRVAKIVEDCTDAWGEPKPPWQDRKEAYLAKLTDKPDESLLVSLADKTHNARAIVGDLRCSGSAVWDRFKGGREGTLWYYRELTGAFRRRFPGPLVEELARLTDAMHEAAG